MRKADKRPPPDALMLLGTHCPHCPTVLKGLGELVKKGSLGRLEAVNIEQQPDVARALGVRSVPWVRIGPFELEGLRSEKELGEWAEKAGSEEGMAAYLDELLSGGKINQALKIARTDPAIINALLMLFQDPDIQLNTRIGISAIMEDLQGSDTLKGIVDQLGVLTRHAEARIRGDACHYLELSGNTEAIGYIQPLLDDSDAHVREVARESLQALGQ